MAVAEFFIIAGIDPETARIAAEFTEKISEKTGASSETVSRMIMNVIQSIYTASVALELFKALEAEKNQESGKIEPKRFRCRVCGNHYDYKSDAKECERSHNFKR